MSKEDTNIEFEEIDGANAADIENTGIDNIQDFIDKNKNAVLIGVLVIIALIIGAYYYVAIMKPKAETVAHSEMFDAEYYFEQDSFGLALNSPGGFLNIIEDHGGTQAGKLANYYAGMCYYNLANYPEAVNYLKNFSTDDEIFGALALGNLGDAQMENGDVDDALNTYKKAVSFSSNDASTPYLLKKAGIAFEQNGNAKQAFDYYSKIKSDYSSSNIAIDIDKYIGRAEANL